MTENKFDLLTAKVDEESQKSEAVARLAHLYTEVARNEGLGFDETYAALSRLYFLMGTVDKSAPKTD